VNCPPVEEEPDKGEDKGKKKGHDDETTTVGDITVGTTTEED
jgi:hypothetical protein